MISLFTGAMGLDLGLEQSGFETVVCNEIDKTAVETIRHNTKKRDFPVIHSDFINITVNDLIEKSGYSKGDIDLVCGGPPCQPFSTAGAHRSMSDFRGNVIINVKFCSLFVLNYFLVVKCCFHRRR